MCDYSLAHFPNRLAVEGDRLQVYRFTSGTLGLIPQSRNLSEILCPTAVCVPPGARLLLHDIPECLRHKLEVAEVEEVTFFEQSAQAFSHRDGVRFSNSREVLLQDLRCGQRVEVVSLTSMREEGARYFEEEQRREALVY
jgi:hypothetical protein